MNEPFAMVPEWLLLSQATGNAIKLFAILHRHDGDGGIFPSRHRLADLMRCSVDTIDRLTHQLEKLGAITVEVRFADDGDRTSNAYRLHFAEDAAALRPGSRTDAATGSRTDAATGSRTAAALTRPPLNETPLNESSSEKQLRFDEISAFRAAKLAAARIAYELVGDDWIGDAAWAKRKLFMHNDRIAVAMLEREAVHSG